MIRVAYIARVSDGLLLCESCKSQDKTLLSVKGKFKQLLRNKFLQNWREDERIVELPNFNYKI